MAQSLERRLADIMHYEYCVFYPSARAALSHYKEEMGPIDIPSNVCPVLEQFADNIIPISPTTGLAPSVAVQLYGFRQEVIDELDLDPLMTGALCPPVTNSAIISFGRHKTIELGAGGALLTNDRHLCIPYPYGLPEIIREQLDRELDKLWDLIRAKWLLTNYWDKHLGDSLTRIPQEQVIPWRVMRRVPNGKRDAIVKALRAAGFNAGTNYPPLPGVVHPDAISWGNEVINLWGPTPDIEPATEIIKRVMDDK